MKISTVSFDSFNLNSDGAVELHYSWDNTHHFVHKLKIPLASHNNLTKENWEVYAFHLGLARFPYYFSLVWPERVVIKAGSLNSAQLAQWKSWYINGLAEFLYKNDLPFDINLSVENGPHHLRFKASEKSLADKYIVLNGGGKDSAVAGEVLKALDIPFSWLTLGTNPAQKKVIEASQNSSVIKVGGRADKYRKELKKKFGLLKGHQPLSLYLSFVAAMAAELGGSHYIIAANEKSANYPNLVTSLRQGYGRQEINHQYTKSYGFEKELHDYIKLYLNPQLSYFSLLRPLYEVQILKIFSGFTQYHDSFISCNNSIHEGSWCGRCSKCAFVYLALYCFLGSDKTDRIVGKNMLDDVSMLPRYLSLTGVSGHKPFECVGTIEENMAIMYLASLIPHPPTVVKYFIENVPELQSGKDLMPQILGNFDEVNLIPTHLKEGVKKVLDGLLKD